MSPRSGQVPACSYPSTDGADARSRLLLSVMEGWRDVPEGALRGHYNERQIEKLTTCPVGIGAGITARMQHRKESAFIR